MVLLPLTLIEFRAQKPEPEETQHLPRDSINVNILKTMFDLLSHKNLLLHQETYKNRYSDRRKSAGKRRQLLWL